MLQVQLAEAYASAVAAESRETAMSEALKEAEDWHAHQLGEAYLITRAKHRMLATKWQDPLIVEGIPIHPPERRRTGVAVPPAPPPLDKNPRAWRARMEALQGREAQEDSPTMVHLTTYLLALDEQYDRQALELRKCLRRAEEVEIFSRML